MPRYYNVQDYGAVADNGATNNAPLFTLCYMDAVANGGEIYIPGNANGDSYGMSQWDIAYSGTNYLNPSVRIIGDGQDRTILSAFNANQAMINLPQTGGSMTFQRVGKLEGLTIDCGNKVNTLGIRARALFQWDFEHIDIKNSTTNGITIINQGLPVGDNDASNQLYFKHCRIENCDQWGIAIDAAASNNETSFMVLESCFITECGTPGWIGGGMFWKGQCLTLSNCAFTRNQNSGLWIPGGAGLSSNLLTLNTTFENNYKRHITILGIKNADFHSLQMYSNDLCKTDYGIYLNAADAVISNVKVHSCKLRATAGNTPHVAFLGVGVNLVGSKCNYVANQLNLDNYGYAGQTLNVGWTAV